MAEKKKYVAEITFRATLEGESEADAIYGVGGSLKYGFDAGENVKSLGVKIVREVRETKAIAEAPFADQVKVEEDGSGLPPISTTVAEEAAVGSDDGIPF